MDGVLIDSVKLGLNVRKELLRDTYGVDLDSIPDPRGEGHRVFPLDALLEAIKSHTGLHISAHEFAHMAQAHMKRALIQSGMRTDPDLARLLQHLKRQNIALGIASTSLRKSVDNKLEVLKDIRDYFSVIITGDDVVQHKPHPESYQLAAWRLGVQPADCVVIEDSQTGVQAGIAAGCQVIGFTQYSSRKVALSGVTATIDSWHDMLIT